VGIALLRALAAAGVGRLTAVTYPPGLAGTLADMGSDPDSETSIVEAPAAEVPWSALRPPGGAVARAHPPALDVLDLIMSSVRAIAAAGLETVVVDVTSPDIRDVGLHVYRAVIPCSQPLFFGTGMQRISPRARTLVYPDRAADGINLHAHPFP
jgi:hypothetical protein